MAVAAGGARGNLRNFSLLVSHVLVPPAIEAILAAPDNRVQGFLAAGHVCAVMGYREYEPIARRHRVPIVVTGFEPLDILQGSICCMRQLEDGQGRGREPIQPLGAARGQPCRPRTLVRQVFAVRTQRWRGIGEIPASGLGLAPDLRRASTRGTGSA